MYILFIVLTFAGQMDLIRQKRKEQTREVEFTIPLKALNSQSTNMRTGTKEKNHEYIYTKQQGKRRIESYAYRGEI